MAKHYRIQTYPRVHVNSIDLSYKNHLSSGGIGFQVIQQPTIIEIKLQGNDNSIPSNIKTLVCRFNHQYNTHYNNLDVSIVNKLDSHIGLGSSTQIEASIYLALYHSIFDRIPSINDFTRFGIGNLSTVGLNLFLKGGFVIDFGYYNKYGLLQGIVGAKKAISDCLTYSLPKTWKAIILKSKKKSLCGKDEQNFLLSNLPVYKEDAFEISYNILMGVIPSIIEEDFQFFITSLKKISNLGLKAKEIVLNSEKFSNECCYLYDNFGFVGVSSLGPTMFTFSDNQKLIASAEANFSSKNFEFLITNIKSSNIGQRYELLDH